MIDIEHIIKVNLINLYDNNKIENINDKINQFIKIKSHVYQKVEK